VTPDQRLDQVATDSLIQVPEIRNWLVMDVEGGYFEMEVAG